MTTKASSRLFIALMTLVVLAPLPLGGQRPLAWTLWSVATGLLICAWALSVFLDSDSPPLSPHRPWAAVVMVALVLVWAIFQAVGFSPDSWHHPLWAERLAGGLPEDLVAKTHGAISLDPARTWTGVMRILMFSAIFWLSSQICRDRGRARLALITVAITSTLYACYGLTVHFSGLEKVLWIDKWAYQEDLTATFVNRNSYGAFAGLGLLCCLALFVHGTRAREEWHRYERAESLATRAFPFLAMAMLLGMALLLSHSRGALLSTMIAIGTLVTALRIGGVTKAKVSNWVFVVLGVLAVSLFLLSGNGTTERFLSVIEDGQDRASLYSLVLTAINDAPWTGFGLGAFEPAFHLYRSEDLLGLGTYRFAHGVQLELIMDLGLPCAALFLLALLTLLVTCARGLRRRRRDQIFPAVALASGTLLGVHGLMDFSAQMPGTAILFAHLLGLGYAQSFNSPRRKSRQDGNVEESMENSPPASAQK